MGRKKYKRRVGIYMKGNPFEVNSDGSVILWTTKGGEKIDCFLIDEGDLARVAEYTWHVRKIGYVSAMTKSWKGKRKTILLHRFIMGAEKAKNLIISTEIKPTTEKQICGFVRVLKINIMLAHVATVQRV